MLLNHVVVQDQPDVAPQQGLGVTGDAAVDHGRSPLQQAQFEHQADAPGFDREVCANHRSPGVGLFTQHAVERAGREAAQVDQLHFAPAAGRGQPARMSLWNGVRDAGCIATVSKPLVADARRAR